MTSPVDPVLDCAQKLLACLQVAVEAAANPPKNVQFLPGAQATADISQFTDLCCQGTAYVRLANIYPSGESWPAPDSQGSNCAPFGLGIIAELGVMRCSPSGNVQQVPTAEAWSSAFTQQMIDAGSIRTALCTFRNMYINAPGSLIAGLLESTGVPVGPEGGCLEWSQTVNIQIIGCAGC